MSSDMLTARKSLINNLFLVVAFFIFKNLGMYPDQKLFNTKTNKINAKKAHINS